MAITAAYEDSASISTTEYSLPNDANYSSGSPITDDGIWQAFIYIQSIAAGDNFQIRVYEKVLAAGTQRIIQQAFIIGSQGEAWVSPSLILMNGWDITVDKIAGTDRTVEWSIRRVV